jgi:trehalose utilization protein
LESALFLKNKTDACCLQYQILRSPGIKIKKTRLKEKKHGQERKITIEAQIGVWWKSKKKKIQHDQEVSAAPGQSLEMCLC